MKQINWKKIILPNIPYVAIALFATKLGQSFRLSSGADLSGKLLHLMEGMTAAFATAAPSFHPIDLCVGIAAAAGIFESLVPDTIPLTEEQFKTFLEKTVMTDHARRLLDELTAQNAARAATEGVEVAAQGNTRPAAKTAHTANEGGADGSMDGGGLQG